MKKIPAILLLILFSLPSYCQAQWENLNSPHFNELAVSGNTIFGIEENTGVHLSTNEGISWAQTSLNVSGLAKITAEGPTVFAGTGNIPTARGVYRSTNGGQNWTYVLPVTEFFPVTAIAISGNNIFAATGRTIYRSTNNGTNWVQSAVDFYTYTFAINGSNIFAGAESTGIYLSTNNGTNWTHTPFENRDVLALKIISNNIFAGSETGVYVSTNNGSSWALTGLGANRYVASLVISSISVFAGTDAGVFLSNDNGKTWTEKNQGMSGNILENPRLAIFNNYLLASNSNSSTYRRSLSEIISVTPINQIIPDEYKLVQNYPNPFNPTTNIKFSIPQKAFVTLKIYNLQGKEISVLVNEELTGGNYEYSFTASALPSGTYFYKLETENFSETKSMVLLK
jgi:photosystem II stability/assembly factor-like uncharacterized protein